ncbi:hypothetical protein Bca4012_001936 [Brassica carinata]|uniref:Phorbol-ester/DAG-type domain-containing protein n=1 Tax=Brassica carinata TaxID=52824 RepID=A0A8X7RW74_BRACI|nr:hypothetical protein Bca52824_043242 [Brassica carinata]
MEILKKLYRLLPSRGLKCEGCNLVKTTILMVLVAFILDSFFTKNLKTHEHCLYLIPKMVMFTCHLCGLSDNRFPYACNLCDLSFHKDCTESTPEINYSCHPKHILKRLTHVSKYTNEKCCLCGNKLYNVFYHCYICNFSAHEHSLTLMPQRSFVCNACGMDDDPNPYVCLPCNFMIHKNCIDMPRIIKINRHDHRIYYNNFLDTRDWKCGVCHKEMSWMFGAYSCSKCPDLAIHLRCISDKILEVKSYEMIEEGVIKHSGHADHTLKLKEESDTNDKWMWCKACLNPIFFSPFYSCMKCDDFILHKKCAFLPTKKIDSFYKTLVTLITTPDSSDTIFVCNACQYVFQGFHYKSDDGNIFLDVRCGSISDSFSHESHLLHLLYITYSTEDKICNACGDKETMICEEELNPDKWFYSCEQCGLTFHIKCTLGDFTWMKQKGEDDSSRVFAIFNNRITRPICNVCHSRCQFSSTLKLKLYISNTNSKP